MLFSLNVMDAVEDRIEDINNLGEEMGKKGRMKIIKWLFTMLLNEGADDGEEPLTETQVGKMIHGGNFNEIHDAILHAFRYGNGGTTDEPEENEDEPGNA